MAAPTALAREERGRPVFVDTCIPTRRPYTGTQRMDSQLGGSSDAYAYACSRESGEFVGRMQCDRACRWYSFVRVGALCAVSNNTGESRTARLAAVITGTPHVRAVARPSTEVQFKITGHASSAWMEWVRNDLLMSQTFAIESAASPAAPLPSLRHKVFQRPRVQQCMFSALASSAETTGV